MGGAGGAFTLPVLVPPRGRRAERATKRFDPRVAGR
jgi:hypothetical protein